MTGWNLADIFDVVAAEVPGSTAVIQGPRRVTWHEFDRRAQRVAMWLTHAGLGHGDKVVQHLRNCPEYLESFTAAMKASLVPVNSNYRYASAELIHLWRDCDASAVVFSGAFAETVDLVRSEVPEVAAWLWVDDGVGRCPAWATPYEQVAGAKDRPGDQSWQRDGDDLVLLYTGGTTGLPKGVMWRQDDLLVLLGNASGGGYPDEPDLAYARVKVAVEGRRHLPAAPLMHGAGSFTCLPVMARGGTVVFLEQPSFDPHELLDVIERERVNSVSWVGDAFARPVAAALEAEPERWDLSSWSLLTSGGALFSDDAKRDLHERVPGLMIADVYGSSEALAAASSVSTAGSPTPSREFTAGTKVVVIDDDGNRVPPGSGQVGNVAYSGRLPMGYYKDQRKSAETFRLVRGQRHTLTGDLASVTADGRIALLGRGSSCINTGGEKVYPEEVEEVLMRHPSVADVAVFGLPDARFGERIVAAVRLAAGHRLDADVLREHVRQHLAGYKAPRDIVAVDEVDRGPSGKIDVPAVRSRLEQAPGVA